MKFSIIPKPLKAEEIKGCFTLDDSLDFKNFPLNSENDLKIFLKNFGLTNFIAKKSPIEVVKDNLAEEEYKLEILPNQILIRSGSDSGVFYAVQTLKQIINQYFPKLPCVKIEDKPKMQYRGYMLDVGRYYFPVSDIKKQIDYASMLKLNVFHWHLTEDQGWRIEIKKYPLLTEKGSKRKRTNFHFTPIEGFYTQEEIKDIVNYAHKKHMIVIPEIDMPGHIRSAIACYPYLSCFDRELEVAYKWGVKHDIICAGKESTYEFLENVLSEVIELFPDGYIHLGGDEAVKTRWELCPHCQAKMKENNLENEEDLQTYFLNRLNGFVKKQGYKAIMWNQHKEGMLNQDLIWEYWTATENIGKVLSYRKIINGESVPYYLDLPYAQNTLKGVYDYNNVIDENYKHNLLGVELSLWTEFVPDQNKAEKMTFPRIFAGAERAWSEEKNYEDFISRLDAAYKLLDRMGIKYRKLKYSNPNRFLSLLEKIWWARRQLLWEGLGNLIDNNKVKKIALKKEKEIDKND